MGENGVNVINCTHGRKEFSYDCGIEIIANCSALVLKGIHVAFRKSSLTDKKKRNRNKRNISALTRRSI